MPTRALHARYNPAGLQGCILALKMIGGGFYKVRGELGVFDSELGTHPAVVRAMAEPPAIYRSSPIRPHHPSLLLLPLPSLPHMPNLRPWAMQAYTKERDTSKSMLARTRDGASAEPYVNGTGSWIGSRGVNGAAESVTSELQEVVPELELAEI
ncbi:hypothetical protein HETIRDRAFT_456159 [Heterobasidion irregulare TC 32-1]|uniref:Uncharacterized protein n=1 Tax=Heterobasidion irregulare (strain TC 32-1) TaxID=747525 RepID=W4JR94_HETIT|nr:uncharacterized protein HETIRDRAFT_456159 [Heterobasidion irregulare TC 32-1]ETW75610.1 hypothetical protein HETIRDRAFT_456159 [Heterobasidion irregulare TC 32-1]